MAAELELAALRSSIRSVAAPLASALGLSQLSAHSDVLVASALLFWAVHALLSPWASAVLFRGSYGRLARARDKNNWNARVVSLVHALVIVPLAWRCLRADALDADRAFGWDARAGTAFAVASGYFLWDTLESIVHFSDVGFVIHGLACLLIYLLAFQPFIAYYGPRFLLWELSTPFLNIHWFLDKMSLTGSRLQLINGIVLLATFASVRLIYGSMMSYRFFHTLYAIKDEIPLTYVLVYGGGNIVLNGLNWLWFAKMISALQRRLGPGSKASNSGSLKRKSQ